MINLMAKRKYLPNYKEGDIKDIFQTSKNSSPKDYTKGMATRFINHYEKNGLVSK